MTDFLIVISLSGPDPNQLPAANPADPGPGQRPLAGQPVLPAGNQTQIRQDMAPEEKLNYHQLNFQLSKKISLFISTYLSNKTCYYTM